jgi:hypothetical protein
MKHLIVGAHPAEDSFTITIGLTRAYAAELEKCGQSQRTCDLYRMGFNPVLTARELAADHPAEADVAQAQSGIRTADVLTLVYPLWWMSMPAMMKGYIDRVATGDRSLEDDQFERRLSLARGHVAGDSTAPPEIACALAAASAQCRWAIRSTRSILTVPDRCQHTCHISTDARQRIVPSKNTEPVKFRRQRISDRKAAGAPQRRGIRHGGPAPFE